MLTTFVASDLQKYLSVLDDQAAETASDTVNSSGVDLSQDDGYDACLFIAKVGTLSASATPTFSVQQSSDNGSSDAYTDLKGTGITLADTDDDALVVLDVRRPQEKWLRLSISRDGNGTEIDSVVAVLYSPRTGKVSQAADVAGIESHLSPDEGTA